MRVMYLALVVCAALTVAPSTQTNSTGTWAAEFTGPIGDRPKPFGSVVFHLQVSGNDLTGTAHMGSWPGDAPITDVEFDGQRFSFTAVGSKGWSTQLSGQPRVDHCCPKMLFEGTIHGGEMTLTMVWSSTEAPSDDGRKKIPMAAKKFSDDPNDTLPDERHDSLDGPSVIG